MKNIDSIKKIVDEMAVFSVLAKDLPKPYKYQINSKIQDFNTYLSEILTIETEKFNAELQNYGSDLLTELEAQQYGENE